jgi:hypothetical protein
MYTVLRNTQLRNREILERSLNTADFENMRSSQIGEGLAFPEEMINIFRYPRIAPGRRDYESAPGV